MLSRQNIDKQILNGNGFAIEFYVLWSTSQSTSSFICQYYKIFFLFAGRVKRKNMKKAQGGGGDDDDED